MTVKIKVSYENDRERDQVLRALRPVLGKAKVKHQTDRKPYKHMYIEVRAPTCEDPQELLQRILSAIGHMQLTDIRPQHLNQFYDNLGEDGQNKKTGGKLSNKTILEHHRLISTIMTQAEKEMLIPYNPARRATPPRAKKPQVNHFQIDETNRIIDCLDSEPLKGKVITYLLIVTGCRRGEILGLRWRNVDFDTGVQYG